MELMHVAEKATKNFRENESKKVMKCYLSMQTFPDMHYFQMCNFRLK
jgi:hypothetical protein